MYYVFGRYPKTPDGDAYPVLDLVLCHGSFLNADSSYVHKNKSFRGFGSYGDILVRDRKMYVAPTPFALVEGTAHRRTLILPHRQPVPDELIHVGTFTRIEVDLMVVVYRFDLRTNNLETEFVANPNGGRQHTFKAYRLLGDPHDRVSARDHVRVLAELEEEGAEYGEE